LAHQCQPEDARRSGDQGVLNIGNISWKEIVIKGLSNKVVKVGEDKNPSKPLASRRTHKRPWPENELGQETRSPLAADRLREIKAIRRKYQVGPGKPSSSSATP